MSTGPAILLAAPYLTMGGAEAVLSQICRYLAAQSFRIFIVTTVPPLESQGDTTPWFEPHAAGIYHLPQMLDVSEWPAFIGSLIEEHGIQVIWQVGSAYLYDLLPRIRTQFPSVTVADLLFNPEGHAANHLKYRQFIDQAITEYEGLRTWLVVNGQTHVTVIPNGVDLTLYAPKPRAPGSGAFTVAFFGRLSEEKAPDLFIEIAAVLAGDPRFEFLLCGTGPLEPQLRAAVEQHGLSHRIQFTGFVSTREMLPRCGAVVVCSRLDGRPNIVMESLAAGVPVVASRVGGIPDMVKPESGAVLCEPGDIPAYARAIAAWASDPEQYRRSATAARAYAESHFSIENTFRAYETLFRSLARPAQACASNALRAERVPPFTAACRVFSLLASPPRLKDNLTNAGLWLKTRQKLAGAFDSEYYRRMYPDVARSGIPPLLHYVFAGYREGRNPSRLFDTRRYQAEHSLVRDAGPNPLLHSLMENRS